MESIYDEIICHGFCNILANELNQKLNLPIQAAIDYDFDLESSVLVHMWNVLPNGKSYDGKGIMPSNTLEYLKDNYEELDKFFIVTNSTEIQELTKFWTNSNIPLPSKNDFLQSAGNTVQAEQYLKYHIDFVSNLLNN